MVTLVPLVNPGLLRRGILAIGCLTVFVLNTAPSLFAQSYVSGFVYLRKGTGFVPIPKARVEAHSTTGETVIGQIHADAFGHYVLSNLPAGEIVLVASHPRYYPVQTAEHREDRRVRCSSTGSCGTLDFELIPNGDLEVTVTNSIGDPVNDVLVTVRDLADPARVLARPLKQRTESGVFQTSEMRPGRYRVEVEPTKRQRDVAYHPIETELEFKHGEKSQSIRLVMPATRTYRVSGVVLGLERSLALRLVVVLDPDAAKPADADAKANRLGAALQEDGGFVVNGVPRGTYSLELIQTHDSASYRQAGPPLRLGTIRVDDDLPGLLFILPTDVGPKPRRQF